MRLVYRLRRRVLLTEAIVVEGDVLLLLLWLRMARHPLMLSIGRLLHLMRDGCLLVEVWLRRILLVLLLSGIWRLPRRQPAAEGHYGGLMRESCR